MKRKRQTIIRIIALVLALLLVGGVVVGTLVSAFAEGQTPPARDRYTLTMEYMEDEQALRVGQRLVYVNRTGDTLDRVVFNVPANLFRRESALIYENDDLGAVFPQGYAPGGVDLRLVQVDGQSADYGFIGENETSLRVACALKPGESAVFEFEYYLLVTRCGAFIGTGDTDVRLSAFYFIPGVYDAGYREFIVNKPLAHTRWLFSEAGDYEATLVLPEGFELASVGEASVEEVRNGTRVWAIRAENVREFALSFGRRYRSVEGETPSGVRVCVLASSRRAQSVLDAAIEAVSQCEAWFGPFPFGELVIAQSDYPLGALNFPGYIQLSSGLFERGSAADMRKRIRFCAAQQYFGLSAYVEPSADAWLSDSVCEYLSYLMLEEAEGRDAFLAAVNRDWVSALQLTIPGGLRVNSDAALFDAREYDIVVLRRGAVVMHELRQAMGEDMLIEGLAAYYRLGQDGHTLTEMELVQCFDAATGGSWEDFLTDWVFNVGDYVNQNIDWFN